MTEDINSIKLDARSERNLQGVHPDLALVVRLASKLSPLKFIVTEGLRTKERQADLVRAGASKTYRSRHITGHAVDIAVKVGNEVRWDWPLYRTVSVHFKEAARRLGVELEWGGDWITLKDGPHYQLTHRKYPA